MLGIICKIHLNSSPKGTGSTCQRYVYSMGFGEFPKTSKNSTSHDKEKSPPIRCRLAVQLVYSKRTVTKTNRCDKVQIMTLLFATYSLDAAENECGLYLPDFCSLNL